MPFRTGVSVIKGMYNNVLKPVAVDLTGHLISVMKGEYLGILQTIALDKNHAMKAVLYEAEDVWGTQSGVGLSENAVRSQSVPILYDRRGNVIFWDGFDTNVDRYSVYKSAASTVHKTATVSKFGDFSLKCVTGAVTNDLAGVQYMITDFHDGRIGIQLNVWLITDPVELIIYTQHYDGTNFYEAEMIFRIDTVGGTYDLKIVDDTGTEQTIANDVKYQITSLFNFVTMKLVFDSSTHKYVRCLFARREFDCSTYGMKSTANTSSPNIYIKLYNKTKAVQAATMYMDNYVITENEPPN